MTEREFRAWLGGLIEGFAGRTLEGSYLESLVHRIIKNAPTNKVMRDRDAGHAEPPEDDDSDEKGEFLKNYAGPTGAEVEFGADGEVTAAAPTVADLKSLRNPDGSLKKLVPVIPKPPANLTRSEEPASKAKGKRRGLSTPKGDPMSAPVDATPGVVMMTSSPVRMG